MAQRFSRIHDALDTHSVKHKEYKQALEEKWYLDGNKPSWPISQKTSSMAYAHQSCVDGTYTGFPPALQNWLDI